MAKTINDKWSFLMQINKEIDDLYHKIATYYGLSDSAFWILYSLYENKDGLTQKDICSNWSYSKQTINSAIKNLLEKKYVDMEVDIPNNHGKKICLTSLGIEIAEKTIKRVIFAEEQSFSKTEEKDIDKVIEVFSNTLSLFKNEINKICMSSEDL